MQKICLFLNGKLEFSPFKLEIQNTLFHPLSLSQSVPKNIDIYVADGGLNHILNLNLKCTHFTWAGDGDSLNTQAQEFLQKDTSGTKEIVPLNPQKDLSDLGALLDIIAQRYSHTSIFIEVIGGLGGTRAHEAANIAEIKRLLSDLPKGGVAFFHGGVVVTNTPVKFVETTYKLFSVFDNKPVEIEGCAYSGRFALTRPSHGLSNTACSETVSITPLGGVSTIYFED